MEDAKETKNNKGNTALHVNPPQIKDKLRFDTGSETIFSYLRKRVFNTNFSITAPEFLIFPETSARVSYERSKHCNQNQIWCVNVRKYFEIHGFGVHRGS